jgi:hypothetical protein
MENYLKDYSSRSFGAWTGYQGWAFRHNQLNALQHFTRFREGLKCVQVYLPGGYFGQLTVELAKTEITPAAHTAVAEKIAMMSGLGTLTHILLRMQGGKQIYHVKYQLSDLDSDDSANLCKKRLTSAAAQLK